MTSQFDASESTTQTFTRSTGSSCDISKITTTYAETASQIKGLFVLDSERTTGMEKTQWSEIRLTGFGTETNMNLMNTYIRLAIPVFAKFNINAIIRPFKKLASGGFGTVSLRESIDPGFKQENGNLVILKRFHHDLNAREKYMFYQEISLINALKSDSNIVMFLKR